MGKKLSKKDLENYKQLIIESLCDRNDIKNDVIEAMQDKLSKEEFEKIKPYANINPFAPDADDQIAQLYAILNPECLPQYPEWIQKLIDDGLIDSDGKTVLAKNLRIIAAAIRDNQKIEVQKHHLERFVKAATRKPYSSSQIKKVLEVVNSK